MYGRDFCLVVVVVVVVSTVNNSRMIYAVGGTTC